MKRLGSLGALACYFLALTALPALLWWGYYSEFQFYRGYTPTPFSPEAWAAADPEVRGHMLEDLFAQHQLEGMTPAEVRELLGPPQGSGEGSLRYAVGHRGLNPRVPFAFPYTLYLDLGADGRVTKAYDSND